MFSFPSDSREEFYFIVSKVGILFFDTGLLAVLFPQGRCFGLFLLLKSVRSGNFSYRNSASYCKV